MKCTSPYGVEIKWSFGRICKKNASLILIFVPPLCGRKIPIYSKRDVAKMGQDANTNKKETIKKKPKIQERPAMPIQPFWRESTSSSEMGQTTKTPQKEQQTEEENITQEVEREENPEQTIQVKKSKNEKGEETEKEGEKEETIDEPEKKKIPIKGDINWEKEKKPTRSSTRNHKKPNWLGHNIMVTKVESESSAEESLPSVFEIAPSENK